MKRFRKVTSLLMILAMVFSVLHPTSLVKAAENDNGEELSWEVVENNKDRIAGKLNGIPGATDADPLANLKGDVRVSIVLDQPSTIAKGFDTEGIALNPSAVSYRESLRKTQDDVASAISREALDGAQLDVVWNLTLAANIISAVVPAEKISAIKAVSGVKDVVVETQYEPQRAEASDDPNMSVATGMTNAQYAWAEGYTGAGSLVAIVDTGLDYKHQSFDPVAYEMAITQLEATTGKTYDLLTAQDVQKLWSSLNAAQRTAESPSQTYFNAKVPYGFNYVDSNFNIEHVNDTQGEHGSHVASIAAANKYLYTTEEDGSISLKNAITAVRTQGNAPDAQLLVMKVFGAGGGAYDSDYFAAIEDAIVLGADSVNLSLGSSTKGFSYNSTYQEIINSLTNVNTIWTNSAGNNSSWADSTALGYLYSDYANMGTGGSPATYKTPMSVASVDNDGFTGSYLEYGDDLIFYTETTGYSNAPMITAAGEYEFVYIDGPGVDDNANVGKAGDSFLVLGEANVKGKIALCNRGSSSFFAKANAAAAQGAVAVIIVNNQPGTISMNMTGYTYTAPCVSITQADGNLIKAGAEKTSFTSADGTTVEYYTGTITIGEGVGTTEYDAEYYTMSDFSSYGVPEDLTIKPEITTPGGNIYAVNGSAKSTADAPTGGHDQYENMSGTSMAAPQLAGIVGVLSQFYRESDLADNAAKFDLSKRQVLQSLMMSTSRPLIEEESGSYYSVMKQGSGLADLNAVMNSNIVILMDQTTVNGEVRKDNSDYAADGKVKAELGDDPERTGKYSVSFTLNNLTDEDRFYYLSADFFTQDVFAYYTLDANGSPIMNADGSPLVSTYLDTMTAPLDANLTWYVDGVKFDPDATEHDVNFDGKFDTLDAQMILDVVTGTEEGDFDEKAADVDGDGEITTYDAYKLLEILNQGAAVVPASGTVSVKVEIELTDIADYDDNGAYVEGYIFASEKESEDGAFGVQHSIPVLGYYGNWSEPPMVDVGTALEVKYGLEPRYPYLTYQLGETAYGYNTFIGTLAGTTIDYPLGGNPILTDEAYDPVRNAINPETVINGARYIQVRNSVANRYALEAEDGSVIDEMVTNANVYAAFYYPNGGEWRNTTTSSSYGYKPSGLADGTKVNLSFTLVPEYYKDPATGEINWEEIQPTWELPFVIDGTAPEVTSVFGKRITTDDANTVVVTVTAKDNEYIAGFFAYEENGTEPIYLEGSRTDAKKEGADDRGDYVVMLDGTDISDHIEVEVWDYAGNVTTVQINLNKDELTGAVDISLDAEEFTAVVGNSVQLTASVAPWGAEDTGVIWSSSDESVATVNENGLVTGIAEGTATITAAAHADPTKTATCKATFIKVERELNGIVWDENGEVWFSSFNTGNLPEYTKLNDASMRLPLASTAYKKDGTLYAATFDSEERLSDLYTVNEETFEATLIGSSEIGYMDLAPAPSLGENVFMAVYATYAVIVDGTTGDYLGVFDLASYTGGNYLVGIAYEEQYYNTNYGNTDWYFLVDEAGNLYNTGFLPYGGSYSRFGVSSVGNLGYTADVPYFQSLYYDGTDLYWSNFSDSEGIVRIVFVNDLYNDGSIYSIGSFAQDVWPVGGLYNDAEKELIGVPKSEDAAKEAAVIDEAAVFETEITPIEHETTAVKGSLNAAPAATATRDRADLNGITEEIEEGKAVITIDAAGNAEDEDGNAVTHNGLYEVTYDPEAVTLESIESDLQFKAVAEEEGKVVFAFADLKGVKEGEAVATLKFTVNTEETTTVTVETKESEDDFEGAEEEYVLNDVTIEISDETATVLWFEELQLTAESNVGVTWSSSDESIATVDENGVVTGQKIGTATITATTVVGGKSASCEVTVLFQDVADDSKYYFNPVYWAYEQGITTGYSNGENAGKFGVGLSCTREDFILFLYRLAGQPDVDISDANSKFSDIAKLSDLRKKAIVWGADLGIIKGYSDGTFGVGKNVVRKDAMIMIYRYAGKPAPTEVGVEKANAFTDVKGQYKENTDTFKSIAWAVENGITNGYTSGEYKGQFGAVLDCLREQLITFLYRYDNLD